MTNWLQPELVLTGGANDSVNESNMRFGRSTTIAVAIIGMSGMLEAAGVPICSALGRITQNFATAQSEAKRLRDKAARVSRDWQSPCMSEDSLRVLAQLSQALVAYHASDCSPYLVVWHGHLHRLGSRFAQKVEMAPPRRGG